MTDRHFEQGQPVTWKDASGQRYRGRVVQYQSPRIDAATGATREEEEGVLVIIDGAAHVSFVPPDALKPDERRQNARRPCED